MRRRRFNWKALRITSQIVAVLLVGSYFFALVYQQQLHWWQTLLFQLDPLTHLYLLISTHHLTSWLYALIALVLLFAVSRIFCGWACPLGALLDLVSALRGRLLLLNRWRRGQKARPLSSIKPPNHRSLLPANFDVYLLGALLVLAAFRSPTLWLLDPIVFTFKFLTVVILPVLDLPLRTLVNGLDARFYQTGWWPPVMDSYALYFTPYQNPVYTDTTIFMLLAATIIALELVQKRFWCRYICPLGAMLRLTYRSHPLKRRIRPDCAYCLKCEVSCNFGGTLETDCLYCMECIHACTPAKISFLPGGPVISRSGSVTPPVLLSRGEAMLRPQAAEEGRAMHGIAPTEEDDLSLAPTLRADFKQAYRQRICGELQPEGISRRLLLEYAAAGFVAYPLLKLFDGRRELPLDFIRPPGVYDEAKFTELCLKCGQCMKVCLTNGLQPSLVEAGLSALWTPRLISRLGYCEFNCNLCGQACPSGAIPKLALEEKQRQVLGIAFFDRSRCIPYVLPNNCTVCEEHCPTADKAIKMRAGSVADKDGKLHETQQPYVVPSLCIGCGICEKKCPLPGLSAVRIFRTPPGDAFKSSYGVAGPAEPAPGNSGDTSSDYSTYGG